ncbi:hypothetical protein V2J09_012104 [Rumex salicifolius]
MDGVGELRRVVEEVELVDAHAHNIVAVDSSLPFSRCFSESDGAALSDAPHSLAFKRGVRDIAELYGCKSSLKDIEDHRRQVGLEAISSACFGAARISALLIDDGLDLDKMHQIEWHKTYAPFVGRILRIERLAENILNEAILNGFRWTLDEFTKKEAEDGLDEVISAGTPVHIVNKSLIDYIFTRSLEVSVQFDLPIQLHTGFGDKDLDLRQSNPLHLRMVLEDERFSTCRIVLLHASYPFSREASYLASVYPQVHLDFGLAVPHLSFHGMLEAVNQLLELAPLNKVMFSTDGYAFPEAFYLGAKKAREVVFSVLRDACTNGDLSFPEAKDAARDIFAQNAIRFYKIDPISKSTLTIAVSHKAESISFDLPQENVTLVRMIWVDASGQCRCRVVPSKRFHDVVKKNGVGLTFACMGMTSFTDGPAPETMLTGVGEIRLIPDLSTMSRIPWSDQEEMVLADMYIKPGQSWEYCPREALRRVSEILKEEYDLKLYCPHNNSIITACQEMNAGFENEFYLLKGSTRDGKEEWVPFDSTPYCSTASFDAASPILREVLASLQSLNVHVEQLHAEAGKGQFELSLGHTVCTRAADNLIFTHETIKAIARKHGLLATFMPKYALDDIGSGSHVHLSLWSEGVNVFLGSKGNSKHGMSKIGQEFMAGVLHHLPAIMAFTAPHPNSYDRIQPDTWSGAYQCWGEENREAPIRTACPPGIPDGKVSNFEIKSFDGCANPYLGLAAIIAAGIDGLRKQLPLPKPVGVNPSDISSKLKRLPVSLSEALEALHKDTIFNEFIGEKLLVAVKGVRKAEIEYYLENKEAYKQLKYRY